MRCRPFSSATTSIGRPGVALEIGFAVPVRDLPGRPVVRGRPVSGRLAEWDTLGSVRLRQPAPDYLKLLEPYGELVQALALGARKLILQEAPEASEFVYEVYTIADHFSFTHRPGDSFVYTTTHANWVNVGFPFGSLLPDPDGLLRGEGKLTRHVRIAQVGDLDAPGVRELVRAAIAQAERPEGKAEAPRAYVRPKPGARKSGKRRSGASGRQT
jgi:hypothetical protein